jgi:hypothetical protein
MIDTVEQFHKQTRRRANPALIERWEFHVRFDGDKKIKAELAQARRISTQLDKACAAFSNLSPEQVLSFKAAASNMRKLADDLSTLAFWARDYSAFYQRERKREQEAEYSAKARNRWGDDPAKFDFERGLIREIRDGGNDAHFLAWLQKQPAFDNYEIKRIIAPFSNYPNDTGLNNQIEVMRFLVESHTERRYFSGGYAHASTRDFEDYLKYRLEVRDAALSQIAHAKTSAAVMPFAHPSDPTP